MSPNITTDVLRAQCAELRQQMQALALERDRWRDQAKEMLALLPNYLERSCQTGRREAYTSMLAWCQRHGDDSVGARIQRELTGMGVLPAPKSGCEWCLGRGYVHKGQKSIICPACRCGLPGKETE
jgi:hypothetical protein